MNALSGARMLGEAYANLDLQRLTSAPWDVEVFVRSPLPPPGRYGPDPRPSGQAVHWPGRNRPDLRHWLRLGSADSIHTATAVDDRCAAGSSAAESPIP